ncbi:hypothetical protein Tco_0551860 [Tanacetum coccineum]
MEADDQDIQTILLGLLKEHSMRVVDAVDKLWNGNCYRISVPDVGNQVVKMQNSEVRVFRNIGNGNVVAARAEGNAPGNNASIDTGTQTDKAPVYDSDGSAEGVKTLRRTRRPQSRLSNLFMSAFSTRLLQAYDWEPKASINFVLGSFFGNVRFVGNDHLALQIWVSSDLHWGNILITRSKRIASIKWRATYVLGVCGTYYSRYTWVTFSQIKDEAPEVINLPDRENYCPLSSHLFIIIRNRHGSEFKIIILNVYFDSVGNLHQGSSVRIPHKME